MAYSWIAVDSLDGHVWGELPDFTIDSASVVLGQAQTATGMYPLASTSTPADWLQGTVPWGVAIILLDTSTDYAGNQSTAVVAGWYINQRIRTEGDTLQIPLVTAEGYFDRRVVGTVSFAATNQNTIATTLVTNYGIAPPTGSTGLVGLPFQINVVGAAGTARDRTYVDVNDQTLTTALTELMGIQGGPEWTVTWAHLTSPERYLPVFNVGSRIGSALGPTGLASAVFEMGGTSDGGSVTSVTYTEDWTAGKGANFVTATGNVDAMNNRPQQSQFLGGGRQPALEYRFNPSTSVTDTTTLLVAAQQRLALIQSGSRSLALTSDAMTGPRLGVDWFLGDTVGYSIGGQNQFGVETVPAFPGGPSGTAGLSGTARVVGWAINPDAETPTVTPILGSV